MTQVQNQMSAKIMDRIRPEKLPRQRVQKLWRNVRWSQMFPDETLAMDVEDITPTFALRKVSLLFETKKYTECALIIRRLENLTLASILKQIPIEVLHDSIPNSLCVIEALYVKLCEMCDTFPREEMQSEELIKRLVVLFSRQFQSGNNAEKNCNIYYPSCRNILRVFLSFEPNIKHQLRQRKQALDKCVSRLGQHGLVDGSGGNFMNLHDALKLELERVINHYQTALQKIDSSTKHPTSSSIISGKAPTEASHQRLMQMTRTDVQDRLIKNTTVFNDVQPALTNKYLRKLINILEKRIEYDKIVLFYDTELRKLCNGINVPDASFMVKTLINFSHGYAVMLELLREVWDDEDGFTTVASHDDVGATTDEELLDPMTRYKAITRLNGIIMSHDNIGERFQSRLQPHSNLLANGNVPSVSRSKFKKSVRMSEAQINVMVPPISLKPMETITNPEQEIQRLTAELQGNQELIKQLQDREKALLNRLSEKTQKEFRANNRHFEDLSLGQGRPTALIRKFDSLYSDGRVEALDSLDEVQQLEDMDVLKGKILFSVVVLSFRAAQQALGQLRRKMRYIMHLPLPVDGLDNRDPDAAEIEQHINAYLRKTVSRFDLSSCIDEVCTQIYATLYDYPSLKTCEGLQQYIGECVRVAWGLTVQNPAYIILYDSRAFHPQLHSRFHTSNPDSDQITNFMWPALLEEPNGQCVQKAVVVT